MGENNYNANKNPLRRCVGHRGLTKEEEERFNTPCRTRTDISKLRARRPEAINRTGLDAIKLSNNHDRSKYSISHKASQEFFCVS
jgi:hypothetical protein